MRLRHFLYFLVIAAVAAGALLSCALFGAVSISQRVSNFQDDLNTSSRSSAYENFHPDQCNDYDALKNPALNIDVIFPVGGISWSLDITDDSDSSAVIVHATGNGYDLYLRLDMQETGFMDNRIVSLDTSPDGIVAYVNQIN